MRTSRARALAVSVVVCVAVAVACAACTASPRPGAGRASGASVTAPSTAPTTPGSPSPSGGAPATSAPSPASGASHVSKLLVVVLENHSRGEALARMPALAATAQRYGQATQWFAVAHPSLPNYLALSAGSTFGIRDDQRPAAHRIQGGSVFGQLLAAGHTARAYVEDLPRPCAQQNSGEYAVRHNAWAYFAAPAERSACERFDIASGSQSAGALHDDVLAGRLPDYAQLVPDVCHDGHDCSLATADTWLSRWMTVIEAGPDFTVGRLAVVVTFDEDDHHAGNHVALVVAAARLHGATVSTHFTHLSLAAAPSRLVGLAPLRASAGSPDVLRAFGLT